MRRKAMMSKADVRIQFRKFHAAQKEIIQGLEDLTVLRCGRRFGKTTLLEDLGSSRALSKGHAVGWFSPNYKLLLPTYKRILKTLRPAVAHASKTDALIELETGGSIEFWTLNDEDAGRSRSYDTVIVDEAGLVAKGLKEIWEQSIRPTMLDRRGKAIMAGTPKGIDPENFFHTVCTQKKKYGWKEFHMPTWMNPTLDPVGVENLINEYPPLVYQQEFKAEFVDWSGAKFFSLAKFLIEGHGAPMPLHCDSVFVTVDSASKSGPDRDGTAVCFWAVNEFHGTPLTLLDWDIISIDGDLLVTWLPMIFERAAALARECKARAGFVGALIEDKASGISLIQHGMRNGWPVKAIDSKFTALGKDDRAIAVSGHVYQEKVKMTDKALNKEITYKEQTLNHFITQFFGYMIGVKDQADDLFDAGVYGIAAALGNNKGF
jgi:hypothetical protein